MKAKKEINQVEYDRVPPQAPEIETSIIGQIISDGTSYLDISDLLKPEMFYKEVNQIIFTALSEMPTLSFYGYY